MSERLWYGHWGLLNLYGHWWVNIAEPSFDYRILAIVIGLDDFTERMKGPTCLGRYVDGMTLYKPG